MRPPHEILTKTGTRRVRLATPADLPALLRIERAAHAHPWTEAMLVAEFACAPSTIWVVEGADDPVGFLVLWFVVGEVTIMDVAVSPEVQRQGVARALIEAALRVDGVERVLLEVRVSNAPARALYEALGFEEIGRRARYYTNNGEDACVMERVV